MEQNHLLEIRDLNVKFTVEEDIIYAVNGVNLTLNPGETLGIVGESGCGKSVSLFSILRLVQSPPAIISGEILFEGRDVLQMREKELHQIRGKEITMVFQEPMTCLNPVIKIGHQIIETLILHEKMHKETAIKKTLELMQLVEIPDAESRMWDYPHQLSGGMRQRIMIAMALACKPKILLADEPTTALDVTIQAQILDLLKRIKQDNGMGIILVTHDLGVVAEVAERVAVFYGGRVIEEADTISLFTNPAHPYTEGLLGCIPLINTTAERLNVIEGTVPDLAAFPIGCPFEPRCEYAVEFCKEKNPQLEKIDKNHSVACHLAKERLAAIEKGKSTRS
jgi:oligopeptide/dipeptide ABC transporter ATP-binding protein